MKEETQEIIINVLNRLDDKLDQVKEDTTDIRIVQTKNTADIKYHIKRTDILEHKVDHLMKLDNKVKWTVSSIVTIAAILTFLKTMGII
jgi:hypothetical protein